MVEGNPTPTPAAATLQKEQRAAERIKQIEGRGTFDTCLLLFTVAAVVWFVARWLFGSRRGGSESHGSARWADKKERRAWQHPKDQPLAPGELAIGWATKKHYYKLDRERTFRHIAILGGTGAGKSRAIFLPAAANAADSGTSIVASDPKSELWEWTSGKHEHALRFAPREPDQSSCFNWIPLCTDARLADKCAAAIIGEAHAGGDSFWADSETGLLAAIFAHAATTEAPTPLTAFEFLTADIDTLSAYLTASPASFARKLASGFIDADPKVKGNIKQGVLRRLKWLGDERIQRMTSSSFAPPAFGVLRETPAAVYWCLDEGDIKELQPLTSLFFTIAIEQLKDTDRKKAKIPIQMLLDEFANIGTLKNFEHDITTLRGRGVAIIAGLQSRSQLDHVYGRTGGKIIWDNFITKFVLAGLPLDTAEEISRALGDTTITEERESRNAKGEVSRSETSHARRLLTADEVRRIDRDAAIVISGNDTQLMLGKFFYDGITITGTPEKCGQARFVEPTPILEAIDKSDQKRKKALPPPPTRAAKAKTDPHANDEFDELDVIPPPQIKPIPIRLKRKEMTAWDEFDEHTIYQVEKLPPSPEEGSYTPTPS
jgi:type IV secretory pathway TraG/TraD family ATPase VirD4